MVAADDGGNRDRPEDASALPVIAGEALQLRVYAASRISPHLWLVCQPAVRCGAVALSGVNSTRAPDKETEQQGSLEPSHTPLHSPRKHLSVSSARACQIMTHRVSGSWWR